MTFGGQLWVVNVLTAETAGGKGPGPAWGGKDAHKPAWGGKDAHKPAMTAPVTVSP